jgi:hypothetical protein
MMTTISNLFNGDVIEIEGLPATITEIFYLDEPLMSIRVHTERFGKMRIVTTDDTPVTLLKRGE